MEYEGDEEAPWIPSIEGSDIPIYFLDLLTTFLQEGYAHLFQQVEKPAERVSTLPSHGDAYTHARHSEGDKQARPDLGSDQKRLKREQGPGKREDKTTDDLDRLVDDDRGQAFGHRHLAPQHVGLGEFAAYVRRGADVPDRLTRQLRSQQPPESGPVRVVLVEARLPGKRVAYVPA